LCDRKNVHTFLGDDVDPFFHQYSDSSNKVLRRGRFVHTLFDTYREHHTFQEYTPLSPETFDSIQFDEYMQSGGVRQVQQ